MCPKKAERYFGGGLWIKGVLDWKKKWGWKLGGVADLELDRRVGSEKEMVMKIRGGGGCFSKHV